MQHSWDTALLEKLSCALVHVPDHWDNALLDERTHGGLKCGLSVHAGVAGFSLTQIIKVVDVGVCLLHQGNGVMLETTVWLFVLLKFRLVIRDGAVVFLFIHEWRQIVHPACLVDLLAFSGYDVCVSKPNCLHARFVGVFHHTGPIQAGADHVVQFCRHPLALLHLTGVGNAPACIRQSVVCIVVFDLLSGPSPPRRLGPGRSPPIFKLPVLVRSFISWSTLFPLFSCKLN